VRFDLVDIAVIIHHETKPGFSDEGAILVSDDGDKVKAVWLPKSAIEMERCPKHAVVTRPERITIDKGLL